MTSPIPSLGKLAAMIDHSLLNPVLDHETLSKGCSIAARYEVSTVCVKPYYVAEASRQLSGTRVKVCSVIGFPHGNSTTEIKVAETRRAIIDGAAEIDMVVNLGPYLSRDLDYTRKDISEVNAACVSQGALLKVIFENDFLTDEHVIELSRLCSELNVAFVKTSTGYGFVKQPNGDYNYRGATDHHLKLMRRECGPHVQIKAAGGIRSLDDLLRVRELGVTRVGATATAAILDEAKKRFA